MNMLMKQWNMRSVEQPKWNNFFTKAPRKINVKKVHMIKVFKIFNSSLSYALVVIFLIFSVPAYSEGSSYNVDESSWEISDTDVIRITKNGSITWGDLLIISLSSEDCETGNISAWANTYNDDELLALEGKNTSGTFGVTDSKGDFTLVEKTILAHAINAPIDAEKFRLPFAIGLFDLTSVDMPAFLRGLEGNNVTSFWLNFVDEDAGMMDNYWTMDGLIESAKDAVGLCNNRK